MYSNEREQLYKVIASLVALIALVVVPQASATQPTPEHRVTFCHATGNSATFPASKYVTIETDVSGAFNGHLGGSHQNGNDIIPPFVYNGSTYSQNWTAEGQAIFNNGECEKAAPAPACPVGTTPVPDSDPLVCVKEVVKEVRVEVPVEVVRTVFVDRPVDRIVTVPGPERIVEVIKYSDRVIQVPVVKTVVRVKKVVKYVPVYIVKQCVPGKKTPKPDNPPKRPREIPFTP